MPPAPRPSVSVIVATYNRSNVLALAIESARRQTFEDWEMWVVGDACTDDTGEVVRAIGDERIRFLNLPENCGEQSGPNNEGVRRARGRHVAYLNHDDLWFPDHLERTMRALEAAMPRWSSPSSPRSDRTGRRRSCRAGPAATSPSA